MRSSQHLPELDGIRGTAILMVVVAHYLCFRTVPGSFVACLGAALSLGSTGVDLFFVLSGFLIGGILIDNRASPTLLKSFYVRRACRILPLYYVLLIALAAAIWSGIAEGERFQELFKGRAPVWVYAAFLQNFWFGIRASGGPFWLNITWSLAVEEQSYLFLSSAVRLFSPRVFLCACVLGILACPLARLVCYYSDWGSLDVWFRFDGVLWGVVLAILFRSDRAVSAVKSRTKMLSVVSCLLLAFMAWLTIHHPKTVLGTTAWGASIGVSLITLFYVFPFALVLSHDGRLRRIMKLPLLGFFGQLCYGTYLLHIVVPELLSYLLLRTPPRLTDAAGLSVVLLSGAITIGLAKLSWDKFEKPILALGRSFKY